MSEEVSSYLCIQFDHLQAVNELHNEKAVTTNKKKIQKAHTVPSVTEQQIHFKTTPIQFILQGN
jgi:hypothetical protein